MSFEDDNEYPKDGLTNLVLMYELSGAFDDDRELEMEREQERLDAMGHDDDEPQLSQEELDDLARWDAQERADLIAEDMEDSGISNVTLNGRPVYKDEF